MGSPTKSSPHSSSSSTTASNLNSPNPPTFTSGSATLRKTRNSLRRPFCRRATTTPKGPYSESISKITGSTSSTSGQSCEWARLGQKLSTRSSRWRSTSSRISYSKLLSIVRSPSSLSPRKCASSMPRKTGRRKRPAPIVRQAASKPLRRSMDTNKSQRCLNSHRPITSAQSK